MIVRYGLHLGILRGVHGLHRGVHPALLAVALLAGAASGQRHPGPAVAASSRAGHHAGNHSGQASATTAVSLTQLSTTIGLTTTFTSGNSHMGGIAWVDYNGDHWPDLFISNGSGTAHYLYRNNGNGSFTDSSSLVPKPSLTLEDGGVCFGDIDNDGDQDILVYVDAPTFNTLFFNVAAGGPNLLYVNQGNGTFVQSAGAYGVVDPQGRRNDAAGFADYDRDGFLDLYIGHWQRLSAANEGITDYDRMLHNDGDGTFSDATASTHVNGYGRDVLTNLWFDANMDGWPDLYVGNSHPYTGGYADMDSNDILYMNGAGSGRFWDETGNPRLFGDDSKAAMGADVGDIDADGDWDLYVTDVYDLGEPPFGNALYLGTPEGRMTDSVAPERGVATTLQNVSWPCNFTDFDNDGWVDLWVGTGELGVREFMFMNDQDGTFTEVLVPGFDNGAVKGGSVADYDGDGDMDLCVWREDQATVIYRNDTVTGRNWVQFKLSGTTSNRSAIGATVFVTSGGLTQMRRVSGGDSAHSQQELAVHFGVDQATAVDVTVRWPSGAEESFTNVPVNQLHFVGEGQGFLPEALLDSQARWSQSAHSLTVATVTSRGGRAVHSATGFGPMPYFIQGLGFRGIFTNVLVNPGTVAVVSDSGANWVLNVQVIP